MRKLSAIVLSAVLLLTGCGKTVRDDDQSLEIYIWEGGYGTAWVYALADKFEEQPWVQEKYPDLDINIDYNTITSYGREKLQAGSKANTIDLFFDSNMFRMFGVKDGNGQPWLANLNDIYNGAVPGESVTFKDKMQAGFLSAASDGNYYSVPWAAGMNGILYNVELLEALGQEVPLTTNQFLEVCENIKALDGTNPAYRNSYSIVSSTGTGYWMHMFMTWWAQYEGRDSYIDFWNGLDYLGELSPNIFSQPGRLEALKTVESFVDQADGYMDPSAPEKGFMEAQSAFLLGEGVFHVNGDWFSNEMAEIAAGFKAEQGIDYEISYMKTPVISAIVVCGEESIKAAATARGVSSDAVLAEIVAAIDDGETSYGDTNVTQADFDMVAEARTTVDALGYDHTAVIPEYATGKEAAKDFLRFMSTDVANYEFIKTTKGATLPYNYSVSEKAPELFDSLAPSQQVKIDIYENKVHPITVLPSLNMFKLYYHGEMKMLTTNDGVEKEMFAPGKTADALFQATIRHYTSGNTWQLLLASAGM